MKRKILLSILFSTLTIMFTFNANKVNAETNSLIKEISKEEPIKTQDNLEKITTILEEHRSKLLKEKTNSSDTEALQFNRLNIAAEITPSTSLEVNTNNNSRIIKNPDVSFNNTVDILDLALEASLYSIDKTSSKFKTDYDFNNDAIIDIFDLTFLSTHIGTTINQPSISMETYVGDSFNLPQYLETTTSDGYLTNIKTSWTSTAINTVSETTYNVSGKLTDYNKSVSGTVKVVKRKENINSMSYGLIDVYNNKYYYSNPANNHSLSRCNLDGSYVVKICDDSVAYINVINYWIYYVNLSDNNALYKIKIDGTERTKISTDNVEFMNISNGWIYYSNGSDYYTLYKMKLDGSQRTKLNDLTSLYVSISGDKIYFCDYSVYSDGIVYGNLCAINKDGTGFQDINYNKFKEYSIIGNYIYFINQWNELSFCDKSNINDKWGLNEVNSNYNSINTDGKYLYLSNGSTVFKHDPNISTFPSATQVNVFADMINIVGDSIFGINNDSLPYMFKLKMDSNIINKFGIDDKITALYNVEDLTYQCDNYVYPDQIFTKRLDGTIFYSDVIWDKYDINTQYLSQYNCLGTVKGYNSKVTLTVDIKERGTSNQNLNDGAFTQKGEWIYYNDPADNKLYKMKLDGSEKTKLSNHSAFCINVFGDYVYFTSGEQYDIYKGTHDYMYRVKVDGSNETQLMDKPYRPYNMFVTDGNKIYLKGWSGIYSMNMDGSNYELLIEEDNGSSIGATIALIGDYIVYSSRGIKAYSLSGNFIQTLVKDSNTVNFVTDGRYFYWNIWVTGITSRYDWKTNETITLNIDSSHRSLKIDKNNIYYILTDGIYTANLDATNPKKISTIKGTEIYYWLDNLYITDVYDTKKMYKYELNGQVLLPY